MTWHDWLFFVDVWLSAGFAVEWNSCNLHAGKVTAIYFPGSSAQRCKWPGLVATSSQAFPPSCVVHISMGAMVAYHSSRSSVVIALVGCGCLTSFHPFRAKYELIQKRLPLAIKGGLSMFFFPCFGFGVQFICFFYIAPFFISHVPSSGWFKQKITSWAYFDKLKQGIKSPRILFPGSFRPIFHNFNPLEELPYCLKHPNKASPRFRSVRYYKYA